MKRLSHHQITRMSREEYDGSSFKRITKRDRLSAQKENKTSISSDPIEPMETLIHKHKGDLPQKLHHQGRPIHLWARAIGNKAWLQAERLSALPFIHPKGLALMPDVHAGAGTCVGLVLPTQKALIPSSVGVDGGCGMLAVRLDLSTSEFDRLDLKRVRLNLEQQIAIKAHDQVIRPDLWENLRPGY